MPKRIPIPFIFLLRRLIESTLPLHRAPNTADCVGILAGVHA